MVLEFDFDNFSLKLHPTGLKEVLVKRNKTFDVSDVFKSKQVSDEHYPNLRTYVLMEGEEGASVSTGARRFAASSDYSEYTAALALCSHRTPLVIMGNLFLRVSKPLVPTRFFHSREEALRWLDEMKSSRPVGA